MNKLGIYGTLCLLCLTAASPLIARDQNSAETLSREESVSIDLVATITAINPETREIQLTDGQGQVRSLFAAPRVERFDELKVGDHVNATITVSALAELREPTAEEIAGFGEAKIGVVRAQGAGPVSGSVAEAVTSAVTVVGLDLIGRIITVLTVDGGLVDVQAQNEDNLKQLRLGDTIVVTYSASVVASVVPVAAGE